MALAVGNLSLHIGTVRVRARVGRLSQEMVVVVNLLGPSRQSSLSSSLIYTIYFVHCIVAKLG
jgi:hypothetical protein